MTHHGPWVPVQCNFWSCHKLDRVARQLGLSTSAAGGYIVRMWCWTQEQAPNGDLSRFTADEVERLGACWDGEPGAFIAAVTAHGFLEVDPLIVHDWSQYGGRLAEQRAREAQRAVVRRADIHRTSTGHPPAEKKREEVEKETSLSAANIDAGFELFWADYPRKERKAEARRYFAKLRKGEQLDAITAVGHYAAHVHAVQKEPEFIALPTTFLGRKRIFEDWKDGPPLGAAKGAEAKRQICKCGSDLTYDEHGVLHCPTCSKVAPAGARTVSKDGLPVRFAATRHLPLPRPAAPTEEGNADG